MLSGSEGQHVVVPEAFRVVATLDSDQEVLGDNDHIVRVGALECVTIAQSCTEIRGRVSHILFEKGRVSLSS